MVQLQVGLQEPVGTPARTTPNTAAQKRHFLRAGAAQDLPPPSPPVRLVALCTRSPMDGERVAEKGRGLLADGLQLGGGCPMRARPPDADGSCGRNVSGHAEQAQRRGALHFVRKRAASFVAGRMLVTDPRGRTTFRLPRETERLRAPLFFCFLFLFFVLSFCYFLGHSCGIRRFPG